MNDIQITIMRPNKIHSSVQWRQKLVRTFHWFFLIFRWNECDELQVLTVSPKNAGGATQRTNRATLSRSADTFGGDLSMKTKSLSINKRISVHKNEHFHTGRSWSGSHSFIYFGWCNQVKATIQLFSCRGLRRLLCGFFSRLCDE